MNDNRGGRGLRIAAPGLLVLLCLTAAGCGSYGSVSGKVTYKGEPLGAGTVLFYSEGQATGNSQIGPDGTYKIDKIAAGPVKIAVETASAKPTKRPPGMPTPPPEAMAKDGSSSPLYNPQNQSKGKYIPIPEDYGDPSKSGLTMTVTGGAQPHDIDLPPK
jgi:hypothetical protein